MPRPTHLLVVVSVLCLVRASWAVRSCVNESQCSCQRIGGRWIQPPDTPQPTCRWFLRYQGRQRYADVYLPANYTRSSSYPMWAMLHGLHWTGWWSSNMRLNNPPRGGEAFAQITGMTTGPLRNQAIMVFPDAAGDATRRQFWNSRFWPCAQGVCLDPTIDDLGFLEQLMERLVAALPVNKQQVFMSGYSNGAMMVQTALCSSPRLMRLVKAVALAKSSISQRFLLEDCPAAVGAAMPLLMLADTGDRTFPAVKDGPVMGTPMYSTENWATAWARKRACGFPDVSGAAVAAAEGRKRFSCQDACCSSGVPPANITAAARVASLQRTTQAPGDSRPLTRYCVLSGGSHLWNTPERGLENQLIWSFFQEATQPGLPRSTPRTQCPLVQKPTPAATPRPLPQPPAPTVVRAPPAGEVTPNTSVVTPPAVIEPAAAAPVVPAAPITRPAAAAVAKPAATEAVGRWTPRPRRRAAAATTRAQLMPAAAGQGAVPTGPGQEAEGQVPAAMLTATLPDTSAPAGEHTTPVMHSLTAWLSHVLP